MANKDTYFANHQIAEMKKHFPAFTFERKQGNFNHLIFIGTLQPDETMPVFTVEIHYSPTSNPKAFVIDPPLKTKLHIYDDGSLCLNKITDRRWNETDSIAQFTVPLTALWLYFNEVAKGPANKWIGLEAPHEVGSAKTNK